VHEVRLRLASQGCPRAAAVGFELMENQKFGISQFAEQVNYQRGLEGELSRTIQSIGAVQAARVHLAIPKPTVFVREELKPSASVLLNLYPGRSLDPAQIAGIQNLVAASVPQSCRRQRHAHRPERQPALAAEEQADGSRARPDPDQVRPGNRSERHQAHRDILLADLGPGNFRVQVAADIDFRRASRRPKRIARTRAAGCLSIRSQQTSESASTMPSAAGVPGALSNQPPVPATAPLTQPPYRAPGPGRRDGQPAPARSTPPASRRRLPASAPADQYAQGRDDQLRIGQDHPPHQAGGRRHQAPVRGGGGQSPQGNRQTASGQSRLPTKELKQINDLVKEAMGFNKERGDTVRSPTRRSLPATKEDRFGAIPLWKDPDIIAIGQGDLVQVRRHRAIIAYLMLQGDHPAAEDHAPAAAAGLRTPATRDRRQDRSCWRRRLTKRKTR
jgi:flagellar M-ring protein FliF